MARYNNWVYAKIREDEVGIYRISLVDKNVCYIGMSKHITNRWNEHLRSLKKGTHHCVALQRVYDKFGVESLIFEIMRTCDVDQLGMLEQKEWDDNRSAGWRMLNSRPDGRGGYEVSRETIERIRSSNRWFYDLNTGKSRPDHAEFMRKHKAIGTTGEFADSYRPDKGVYYCDACNYGTSSPGDFRTHRNNEYHTKGSVYTKRGKGRNSDYYIDAIDSFYCGWCDIKSKQSSDFSKHLDSASHMNNIAGIPTIHQKIRTGANVEYYRYDLAKYRCDHCNHDTVSSASFSKHLLTQRHAKNVLNEI